MTGPARHPGPGHRPAAARFDAATPTWVVKVGGRLVEDRDGRMRLAQACAALARPLVVVHGGGDAVSRLQTRLGREPRTVEGRRVTSEADLEVVEMVLSGQVNKSLVRSLRACGVEAVGISGCDAGLVVCEPVPGIGHVGTPARVEPALLEALLEHGWMPVVSPVSLGPGGEPLNVNADELAAAIAAGLGAERLLLLSDVDGVRVEDGRRDEVRAEDVEAMVAAGVATRGMIPKLRAAAAAARTGVGEVRIAGFDGGSLADVLGTRVTSRGTTARGLEGGPHA